MPSHDIEICKALDGQRLDLALVQADIGLSRRKIRAAIDIGGVYVNKKRIRLASRKVHQGDAVSLVYDDQSIKSLQSAPSLLDRDILFVNDDLVVINKPAGVPSQPTRKQSIHHVVPLVHKLLQDRGLLSQRKPILVHRLDQETSGVMVLALKGTMAVQLTNQFRDKRVKKRYQAITVGTSSREVFSSTQPLNKPDHHGYVKSTQNGRSAHTDFFTKRALAGGSFGLVECIPFTGRTHQIRVHLAMKGLPILGDKKYGGAHQYDIKSKFPEITVSRHMLHARSLEIYLNEDGPRRKFTAPYPEDFQGILDKLT